MVAPEEAIDVRGTTGLDDTFDIQVMAHLGNPHHDEIEAQAERNGSEYHEELAGEILKTARGYREELQRKVDSSQYSFNESSLYRPYENHGYVVTTPIISRLKYDKDERGDCAHNFFQTRASGAGQTTQPYKINFEFLNVNQEHNSEDENLIAAWHIFDDDLFTDCEAFMTPEEQQAFFRDYAIMAEISDHDYLHALTIMDQTANDLHTFDADGQYTISIERHALALHAQLMKQSFERLPKKQDKIVEYGQRTYGLLAQMQERIDNMDDPETKQHSSEALTALAESYSQCFFRVISPRDPVLDTQANPAHPSVNDAIEAITMQTNMDMIDEESNYDAGMPNKEKLLLNLSVVSHEDRESVKLRPGMYEDIHDTHKVSLQMANEEGMREVELIELLDICHQALYPEQGLQQTKANDYDDIYAI